MAQPVAVVTGASRGIGKRLSLDLAEAGYDLVCVARTAAAHPSRLPGTVEETAEGVRARGRRAMAVALDVRDEAGVGRLAERICAEWGRCDLLVNNAAVAPPRPALQDSIKRWRLAVDVNLNGPFYLIHHLAPRLTKDGGRIVNVSSAAAVMPDFGRASYTATKRGLEALTEALACDLRDRVAVNCLRIDVPVWSEGFEDTLAGSSLAFEDPVVISDAMLWLARQPLSHTGHVHGVTELREWGIVRPVTLHRAADESTEEP